MKTSSEQNTTTIAFFSPTGTSRNVARAIGGKNHELDLTLKIPTPTLFQPLELLVVAMPVYRGRLPALAVERFQALEGKNTPAIAVVVYGNRAYEDALLELCNLCTAQGFRVAGAGAFVGQHSFSSPPLPIAKDRPDQQDLEQARQFGNEVRARLTQSTFGTPAVPGNRPYKKVPPEPFISATGVDADLCMGCGKCASVCPTHCIKMANGLPLTKPNRCLWCMACIQICPTQARQIILPKIHETAHRLHANCQPRKEPEWFLS
jgi:ferredoxin